MRLMEGITTEHEGRQSLASMQCARPSPAMQEMCASQRNVRDSQRVGLSCVLFFESGTGTRFGLTPALSGCTVGVIPVRRASLRKSLASRSQRLVGCAPATSPCCLHCSCDTNRSCRLWCLHLVFCLLTGTHDKKKDPSGVLCLRVIEANSSRA